MSFREKALLNQQLAALRTQIGALETALDASETRDTQSKTAIADRELPYGVTHVIRKKGGKKILTRIRYFCGC